MFWMKRREKLEENIRLSFLKLEEDVLANSTPYTDDDAGILARKQEAERLLKEVTSWL